MKMIHYAHAFYVADIESEHWIAVLKRTGFYRLTQSFSAVK
jgi:hypothetical protein